MPHLYHYQVHVWFRAKASLKWIICPFWKLMLTQVFCIILLTDSHYFLDILRWTHGPSPDAIIQMHAFLLLPKYMFGLLTDPGFNHAHLFSLFNNHVDHDGYIQCHSHNIRCMSNIVTYLLACTQSLSTGQGLHHKVKTPIPAILC